MLLDANCSERVGDSGERIDERTESGMLANYEYHNGHLIHEHTAIRHRPHRHNE